MNPLNDQQLKSTRPQSADGNAKAHQEDQRAKENRFQESQKGHVKQLSLNRGGQVLLYMKKGLQLSASKQEAFDIFIKDHEEQQIIENNKKMIKKRSAEARTLSEHLNQVRNRIAELKKQLQMRRRQSAAQNVELNHTQDGKLDPIEEDLCEQIKQEKVAYKAAIGRLKALSAEIDHLQLLLERVKVKIQKDFQKWWTQETSNLQGCETGATAGFHTLSSHAVLDASSSGTPDLCKDFPDSSPDFCYSYAEDARIPRSMEGDFYPSSEWRTLDSTGPSSPVPLTGDQQVDADVLAFVRARQNLLSKKAAPPAVKSCQNKT